MLSGRSQHDSQPRYVKIACECLLACIITGCAYTPLVGQSTKKRAPAKPANVKAVFIYSFFRFVGWPDDVNSNQDLLVGIVGNSEVYDPLTRVAKSRKIGGRQIVIEKLEQGDDRLTDCHIVFISSQLTDEQISSVLDNLSEKPILTVSDAKAFFDAGGIITFLTVEDNIRFRINQSAAKQANLSFDAKLLRLGFVPHGVLTTE